MEIWWHHTAIIRVIELRHVWLNCYAVGQDIKCQTIPRYEQQNCDVLVRKCISTLHKYNQSNYEWIVLLYYTALAKIRPEKAFVFALMAFVHTWYFNISSASHFIDRYKTWVTICKHFLPHSFPDKLQIKTYIWPNLVFKGQIMYVIPLKWSKGPIDIQQLFYRKIICKYLDLCIRTSPNKTAYMFILSYQKYQHLRNKR